MKTLCTRNQVRTGVFVSIFFFTTCAIYYFTSGGNTPYDYFVRLSDAFVHGRYWLTENPPWLSELIPAGENKFYTVFPPMPALLLVPFVYLFGADFPQQYLAHLLGAGIGALSMLMVYKIRNLDSCCTSNIHKEVSSQNYLLVSIWVGLLVGFGSIIWYMSSIGSVWYLGQITSAFFLTAALVYLLGKKGFFIVGMFLGAAYLSRVDVILSFPLFIYFIIFDHSDGISRVHSLKDIYLKIKSRDILYFFSGLAPFLIFNFLYNLVRFGVVWDKGYLLIPGLLNEPWYRYGLVNPRYILGNLKVALWSFPKILPGFPYIQPSWFGLAIWITTPAFIYSLFASIKESLVRLGWLSLALIWLVCLIHGGSGWTQFGYRHAVDFYPLLILLTIKGVLRTGLKWHHWFLLTISIIVNLWGVLWINKFGWVSF